MSEKPSNPKDAIGIKKAPLSTVPMNVVAEIGVGMLEGTVKYGRHNYRGVGVRTSVYFDATLRHLIAFWEGEDIDPDTVDLDEDGKPIPGTGVHHVAKALASLTVLRDAQMQGMCTDDRPPRSRAFYAALNKRAAELIEKHAGKNPKHYTIADTKPEPGEEVHIDPSFFAQTYKDPGIIPQGIEMKQDTGIELTLGDYVKRKADPAPDATKFTPPPAAGEPWPVAQADSEGGEA